MRVKVRIYRSHDYDLMLMHYGKMLSIKDKRGKDKPVTVSVAAGLALKAYFTGEPLVINVNKTDKPLGDFPYLKTMTIYAYDSECPGIEKWLDGLKEGNRNNLVKVILRTYLDKIPIWGYGNSNIAPADDIIIEKEPKRPAKAEKENIKPQVQKETVEKPKVKEAAPEDDDEEFDPMALLRQAHK